MIQVTPNPLYVLMVEKSLMASHLPKFEHYLNNALRRDNEEEEEEELEGMSDMEKKRHLLNNPRLKKRNLLNFKPLTELIVDKIAILNDYLLTHTTTFNLQSDFVDAGKTKNIFQLQLDLERNCDVDEEDPEELKEECLETNVHYSKTFKN